MLKRQFAAILSAAIRSDTISGTYTYRSFHNRTELVDGNADKLSRLIFGEGMLIIKVNSDDSVTGTIEFGGDYGLDISGTVTKGDPATISLRGKGRIGTPTAGWIYDYKANTAPQFRNAIDPKAVLLGTLVRTVAHGNSAAGYSASFIMVKN